MQPEAEVVRFPLLNCQVHVSVGRSVVNTPPKRDPTILSVSELDAFGHVGVSEAVTVHVENEAEELAIALVYSPEILNPEGNRVLGRIVFTSFAAEQLGQPINLGKCVSNRSVIVTLSGKLLCFVLDTLPDLP